MSEISENQPKAIKVKMEKRGDQPKVITIKIVPHPEVAGKCTTVPDGDIEVHAGDTVVFDNTAGFNQNTHILIPHELFVDNIRVLIESGTTKEFVISSNYTKNAKYPFGVACDPGAGGPRFVPQP